MLTKEIFKHPDVCKKDRRDMKSRFFEAGFQILKYQKDPPSPLPLHDMQNRAKIYRLFFW